MASSNIIVDMPKASALIDPQSYWSASAIRGSQRLYVGFCELASAALDYAEGLSLLRRVERRHGAARLNWAGTALYYSLVHSARFLIFSAVGDFPTQHAHLSQTFDHSEKPVRTNWLNNFVADRAVHYATSVDVKKLAHFWARAVSTHEVDTHLAWFAEALLKAKALRNENNYEGLLIAHEFHHDYLKDSFTELANAMEATAKSALSSAVDWYARLLTSETVSQPAPVPHVSSDQGGEPKHAGSDRKSAEAAFVRRYVSNRIIEAVRKWYGTKEYVVSNALTSVMTPLSSLKIDAEPDLVEAIEHDVSIGLFDPTAGLMDSFKNKIMQLRAAADQRAPGAGGT